MFQYAQSSGRLRYLPTGGTSLRPLAVGYAGRESGLNDPSSDHKKGIGPLPKGRYTIQRRLHPRFAAPAFYLAPEAGNFMHGRSGFWIHGDNAAGDRSASHGCIVLDRSARVRLRELLIEGVEATLVVIP